MWTPDGLQEWCQACNRTWPPKQLELCHGCLQKPQSWRLNTDISTSQLASRKQPKQLEDSLCYIYTFQISENYIEFYSKFFIQNFDCKKEILFFFLFSIFCIERNVGIGRKIFWVPQNIFITDFIIFISTYGKHDSV